LARLVQGARQLPSDASDPPQFTDSAVSAGPAVPMLANSSEPLRLFACFVTPLQTDGAVICTGRLARCRFDYSLFIAASLGAASVITATTSAASIYRLACASALFLTICGECRHRRYGCLGCSRRASTERDSNTDHQSWNCYLVL